MPGKLLLITPPYHAGVVEAAGNWPHLGFVYLAGHARRAGFPVEIYDAMTKNHSLQEIRARIAAARPAYVGSTGYTSSVNAAVDVLKVAKEVDPTIRTVLGGIHASFCYAEILEQHPGVVDFVVRGEGEETLPDLLATLEAGGDPGRVRGIACRDGERLVVTPARPFVNDLDSLVPAWDLVEWEDYTFHVMPGSRLGLVNSSRGCINACSFCSQQKFWHRTYRARSPEKFVAELQHLHDLYGVDVVMLSDEYPTRDRQRWEAILDLMLERRVQVKLLIETCVQDILRDADILGKYREAGVLHIYVGVEATDQETLDHFKKDIRCEESREAIRLINQNGMISECSFVLGLPHETPQRIENTLQLARHYNPDFAHFLMLAPWPYADSYRELRPHIEEWDYSRYNFVNPVIKPVRMSRDELMAKVVECYRRYYMEKIREYDRLKDPFKREYLVRSMEVMVSNSFLRRYMDGLAEIPEEVRRFLSREKYTI